MGRQLVIGLCWATLLFSGAARSGEIEDAAHAEFRAVLRDAVAQPSPVSSQLRRLTGWTGVTRAPRTAAQRLQALLDAHWAWTMTVQPEYATFTGYPGQNARWSDLSVAQIAERKAVVREALAAARSIPGSELDPDQALNLQLLIGELADEVAAQRFPEEFLPIDQFDGLHLNLAQVLRVSPLNSRADLKDYLQRLDGLPRVLSQVQALLQRGLEQELTPPQVTLAKVPQQILDLMPADPAASPFLLPLENWPDEVSQDDRKIYRDSAQALFDERIRPALEDLHRFIVTDYIPRARASIALTDLPGGEAWYAHRVRHFTTTELSPAQVHELGLHEVKRVFAEMQQLMQAAGHKGDVAGYVRKLAADPAQFFARGADMVAAYRALGQRVDTAVPRLFGRVPSVPYSIQAVPAHEAAGSAAAYYYPGSSATRRPGVFYVNTSRLDQSPRYEMEALFLHEAVPGHHFQISLAQELGELPPFRQHGIETAYVEGWALYAESLGAELGLYQESSLHFGALSYEMWRAVRLVVDTGMHAMGWSRQRAIDYFRRYTGRSLPRIEAEVDRYIVWPAQALAYKIGQLKISELRRRAESQLGDRFDIRAYHEAVLGAGALPLDILELRIDQWIAACKDRKR